MRYKFTLLKDLPGIEKGTVFKCLGVEYRTIYRQFKFERVPYYVISVNGHFEHQEVGGIFDNSVWYKKEIDEDALTDLACPKCASVLGVPFAIDWYNRDLDSDSYGVQYAIGFECVCGHKRILYGTKYGVRRLQEQLENA